MKSFFGKRLTKTHTRFLVMILLLAGVFLILFLLIYKLNNDRKNQLKRSYQTELLAGVQAALAMKTDELYRVIYDYTYWDELVSKVEQPDSSWYPENISTILTSFHFDFAALQNLDGSFRFVDADTGLTFSMILPMRCSPSSTGTDLFPIIFPHPPD